MQSEHHPYGIAPGERVEFRGWTYNWAATSEAGISQETWFPATLVRWLTPKEALLREPDGNEFVRMISSGRQIMFRRVLTARQQLDNLADALVEGILEQPDEDILEDAREEYGDDLEQHLADLRALGERAIEEANRRQAERGAGGEEAGAE